MGKLKEIGGKRLLWLFLYSVSMGFLEAAVVIYLRALFYPQGFDFPTTPLVVIPVKMMGVELGRELATLLMILSVGILFGRSFQERLAGVMIVFGVWDIIYYLALFIVEGWPRSPGTWDVLFLLPTVWVGPVWAPLGVSLALVGTGLLIWVRLQRGGKLILNWRDWVWEIAAGLIIISTFIYCGLYTMAHKPLPSYPWYLWLLGMGMGLGAFARAYHRSNKTSSIL